MSEKPTVVVTGASRRLGLFLCEHLSKRAFSVVAISRNSSAQLESLSGDIDIHCLGDELGETENIYSEQEKLDLVIRTITNRYSRIAAVIHNASVFSPDKEHFSMSDYLSFFQTHMAMPAQLNEGLHPLLFDDNDPGNIIHITDIFAENPNPSFSLYCSTKAALENLSKSYAKKFAPGIRVNTIQPGPIQFLPTHSDEAKRQVLEQTLLPHEGGFMPVFQAVCAIIDNPYITGSTIKVDGGRALGRG